MAASVITEVVSAKNPPIHLPLGTDTIAQIRAKLFKVKNSIEAKVICYFNLSENQIWNFIMSYILQVDFPYAGPWGHEMTKVMDGLARSIADEPGLIWKIWTANETTGEAG